MIILDTNVLSELMKPLIDPGISQWMAGQPQPFAITAVNVTEIEFGLQRLPSGHRRAGMFALFEALIAELPVLPLDTEAARAAGRFQAVRERVGEPVRSPDVLITAIANVHGAAIATRNVRDFSGMNLALIDPWAR